MLRKSRPYAWCRVRTGWTRQIETNPLHFQQCRVHSTHAGAGRQANDPALVHVATVHWKFPLVEFGDSLFASLALHARRAISSDESKRLRLTQTCLDKALEELHVQGRCGFGFGMPLDAYAEPDRIDSLNGLDDSVRRQRDAAAWPQPSALPGGGRCLPESHPLHRFHRSASWAPRGRRAGGDRR